MMRVMDFLRALGRRVRGWAHAARERHLIPRLLSAVGLVIVAMVGTSIGLLLGGKIHQDIGPFSAQFSLRPSLHGGTAVQIPPLGSLDVQTHQGPAHLEVRLDALDQKRTEAIVSSPNGLTLASQTAVVDVQSGVTRLALQSTGAALLGAMALGALIYRDMRKIAMCGGLAVLVIASSLGAALSTFKPSSVEEPQYHGLLANAPAVIGDARSIANRFDAYKAELQRLVDNVSRLYATISTLPVYQPDAGTIRALHVSDLHLNPAAWPIIATVAQQYQINMVLDTGDINDWGTATESSFVDSIGTLKVPYVYIRGNHDSTFTAAAIAKQHNAIVLENSVTRVDGLTIAGIGDPRFTPDKSTADRDPHVHDDGAASHQEADLVAASGDRLASTIRAYPQPVNVALVHDPASAGGLAGTAPLVLAGHLHARKTETLTNDGKSTFMMVQGSTGGAGLRGLEGEQPTPLEMSVLYFDPAGALQAYDDITLGGTGQTEVTIKRHVVKNNLNPPPPDVPLPSGSITASPSVSGTPSPGAPGSPTTSPTASPSPGG